jgi:hypothetical protein
MLQIGDKLIGEAEHFTFEHRVFNFITLLGIFMTSFGTVMDLYYRVNILIDLGFVGCWVLTYYFSRVRGYFKMISVVSCCVFVFAFFPYNWISSGGSTGVLPYYAIVFMAVISIILAGRFRMMMILSMLAVELLLICRDAHNINMLQAIDYQKINHLDLSIHLGVIMVGMAVLIVVYSNTYMKEKARSEKYARAIEEHYQQQLYYMENLEQLIYRLKAERHDFNHHLGVIYGLLEGQEIDNVRNYTKKLVNIAEEFQNMVNIPYPIIRAILNYKLSVVKENQIRLQLKINLPEGLKLNEFDLTIILGNLLDNAMEACAKVAATSRYLDLSILYKPNYLIIRTENPLGVAPVLPEGENRTTKPDRQNHGFGLNNIEYLVNKHHGLIKTARENGVFTVNIALLTE